MTMAQLVVDNRERLVIVELEKNKIPHVVTTLNIGDYQIVQGDEVLGIWERKTYSDLASSLNDKRYREQKHRLTTSNARYKGYILEGNCPTGQYHGLHPGTIDSIRLGLMCRDGFHVITSNGLGHTATILSKMLKKIPEYVAAAPERTKEDLEDRYHCALVESAISSVKKENLTPDTCYLAQLAQIPQISYQSAKTIKGRYSNILSLVTAIDTDRADTLYILSELRCNGRRLGTSVATNICVYLVPAKAKIVIKKKSI
jgi:ERCC4-type nuclease